VRLLAASGCRRARLLLVGPGIPRALAGATFTYDARDLLAPHKCGGGSDGGGSGGEGSSGRHNNGSGGDSSGVDADAQSPRQPYPLRDAVASVAAANPHEVGAAEAAAEAAASRASRQAATAAEGEEEGGVFVLRVAYAPGMFHDQASMPSGTGALPADLDCERQPPHLVACFNAGVW
jgi:hypothetical protein